MCSFDTLDSFIKSAEYWSVYSNIAGVKVETILDCDAEINLSCAEIDVRSREEAVAVCRKVKRKSRSLRPPLRLLHYGMSYYGNIFSSDNTLSNKDGQVRLFKILQNVVPGIAPIFGIFSDI